MKVKSGPDGKGSKKYNFKLKRRGNGTIDLMAYVDGSMAGDRGWYVLNISMVKGTPRFERYDSLPFDEFNLDENSNLIIGNDADSISEIE